MEQRRTEAIEVLLGQTREKVDVLAERLTMANLDPVWRSARILSRTTVQAEPGSRLSDAARVGSKANSGRTAFPIGVPSECHRPEGDEGFPIPPLAGTAPEPYFSAGPMLDTQQDPLTAPQSAESACRFGPSAVQVTADRPVDELDELSTDELDDDVPDGEDHHYGFGTLWDQEAAPIF
ncbi:MAG: hypothetical protein M1823_001254 [Watsoniomyces obsoletus]|nr:MAG: hypothetical protein M1823_001254 [Watsoniomyces obsoletus]